jgi:heat shock protein HtpX
MQKMAPGSFWLTLPTGFVSGQDRAIRPLGREILHTNGTEEADSSSLQAACGLLRPWRPGLRQVFFQRRSTVAIWRTKEVKSAIKTTILLAAMTGVILVIGDLLGGKVGLLVALGIAGVVNFVGYWHSHKIVLRAYRARPTTEAEAPVLHRLVRELCTAADLPMPRLYIIDNDTPNAFATGRHPYRAAIALTRGTLRVCSTDELKGVLAHELSHVKNRDILVSSVAATLAGAVMVLASLMRWETLVGTGSEREGSGRYTPGVMLAAVLAPIAATLIQLAISRTREYEADTSGAKLSSDPMGLANALRKLELSNRRQPLTMNAPTAHLFIVNPLVGGGLLRLFSTHPPIEDRIRRLEQMASPGSSPEYSPPLPSSLASNLWS